MRHALLLAAIAGVASTITSAATICRCGSEYTSVACADERAVVVVASAATAEQSADAREVAQREEAIAAKRARGRRVEEAARKPTLAG